MNGIRLSRKTVLTERLHFKAGQYFGCPLIPPWVRVLGVDSVFRVVQTLMNLFEMVRFLADVVDFINVDVPSL
jgi:hypothetical protein